MPLKPVDENILVLVGPLIDDTNFKSREEAIAYNAGGMEIDVILEKHDGTVTTTAVTLTTGGGDYDWTHTDQGYYTIALPASEGASFNNDTEGTLTIVGYCTGVLPFRSASQTVVPANVWAALIEGTDKLQVDAVEISGSAAAADNVESVFLGNGDTDGVDLKCHSFHVICTDDHAVRFDATAAASKDGFQCHGARHGTYAFGVNSGQYYEGAYGVFCRGSSADIFLVDSGTIENNSGNVIQIGANAALVANNLDHLCKTACPSNDITNVVVDQSIMACVLTGNGDISDYDDTTDSQEAIADAVAVVASAGSGARTITVTVNDGSDPLESASIRFTKGAATYVLQTDSSGNATFNLDDGTYTVTLSLVGYTYAGSSQVVDGNETPTYSMTALTITSPSDPSLCTVQFVVKLAATAVSGAVCKAKLLGVNQAADGTILSNEEASDTTDAQGVAELALVREDSIVKGSGRYKIWVEIAGKPVANVERAIPGQATISFEDLM